MRGWAPPGPRHQRSARFQPGKADIAALHGASWCGISKGIAEPPRTQRHARCEVLRALEGGGKDKRCVLDSIL
eukprot:1340049-Pyramimonas_sp.AAC.1